VRDYWLRPRTGGLLSLTIVIAVLPFFLPNNFYFDVAILIGLNAIICIGLNLLIGFAGQISLGHAGFVGLGAYGSAILTATYAWPPLLALIVVAGGVALLAFVLARPILRLRGHYLAMATLGLGIIISIILNQEGDLTGGPDGMLVPPFAVFGLVIHGERVWYWIVGAMLLLAAWLALNLIHSPIGRALRALHGSEVAARMAGVDVARYKVMVFVVSAVFASVAGSLLAHYAQFVTPATAGFIKSIILVTMVVVGGMASVFGSVIGAAVITALPQILAAVHDYEMLIFGAVLMGFMVFLPKGLLPSIVERVRGETK